MPVVQAGSNYRFSFKLTDKDIINHGTKILYVHGISPIGTKNKAISRSGIYIHPNLIALSKFISYQSDENIVVSRTLGGLCRL